MFWKFGQTANLNPGPAAPNPFSGAQLPPAQPLTADQAQDQAQNAQTSSDSNVPIGVDTMDDNDLWQWLVQAPFQALLAQQNGPNAAKQASIREAIVRHLRQERDWIRPLAKRAFIRNVQRANWDRTLTPTLKRGQATTSGVTPRPPTPPTNPAPQTPPPTNPTPQTPHTNPAPQTPPPTNPTPQTPAPGQPKSSGAPAPQTPPAPQDPLPPNAGPHAQEKQYWEWMKQQQQQMMQQQQQMWNWIMQNGGLRRRRRWGRMAPWQMQPGLPGMNNPQGPNDQPGMPGPNDQPGMPGPGVNNPQGPGPNNPPGMPGPNNQPGVPGAGPGINNPRAGNQRGQNVNTPDPLKVRYQQQREALRQHQWGRVYKWWLQAQRPDLTPVQRERAIQAYKEELERAKSILESFDRFYREFNPQ